MDVNFYGIRVIGQVTIKLSNRIEFKGSKDGVIIYSVSYLDDKTKTHTALVKQFYKDEVYYVRPNGSNWNITGELKENRYKDKDGKLVSTGLYIEMEELGWLELL